jgi:hypothetical protein
MDTICRKNVFLLCASWLKARVTSICVSSFGNMKKRVSNRFIFKRLTTDTFFKSGNLTDAIENIQIDEDNATEQMTSVYHISMTHICIGIWKMISSYSFS